MRGFRLSIGNCEKSVRKKQQITPANQIDQLIIRCKHLCILYTVQGL